MATFSYTKPTVGGSEDTWGDTLNANWDAIGTFLGSLDSTELAVLDGITASTAELNLLDGVTVTLSDITATAAELNLLDGVTASTAEINYLDGVTSSIQTQIDNIPQPPELTQVQVEDDTSTVFGQVSGQRLAQASAKHSFSVTEFTYDFDVSGAVGTVAFTSDLSGFDYLEIESTLSFNGSTTPDLQFSPNGGSTYRTSGYIGGVQDGVDGSSISSGIRLIRTNSDDCLGFCRIIGLGNASVKTTASGVFGGGSSRVTATGGRYNTDEAHNALRINFNGSLTTQGILKLRGYKRP